MSQWGGNGGDVLAPPAGGHRGDAAEAPPRAMNREAIRAIVAEAWAEWTARAAVSAAVGDPASPRRYTCPSAEVRRVALGSDHGGYELKERLRAHLAGRFVVVDLGCSTPDPVDYPDYARAVAEAVARGQAERGVVVDGVGIGSAMAANKVVGVRAACCRDAFEAKNAREHNDTNVLCLGGRTLGEAVAFQVADTWLGTDFGGGRHAGRVDKVLAIERAYAGV